MERIVKNVPGAVRKMDTGFGSGETDMNQFSSHPNHENRPLYEAVYFHRNCSITSRMLNRDFTPAALCSPTNAITPEQVIHHYSLNAQGQ
jgi:hypothetical protein